MCVSNFCVNNMPVNQKNKVYNAIVEYTYALLFYLTTEQGFLVYSFIRNMWLNN